MTDVLNDPLPQYTLTRQASSNDGVLGEIRDPTQEHVCYTCELPWLENAPKTSCIPTGTYTCLPHDSEAHPNTWQLQNVPNRSEVLIHNGNAAKEDSLGCILVGSAFGKKDGLPAVLNSVATLNLLRQQLPKTFVLVIS